VVQIKCLVLPSGRMQSCQLMAGVGGEADTLAVAAVASWRCQPAMLQGQAVAAAHLTTVDYGAPPVEAVRKVVLAPAGALPALPKGVPKLKVPEDDPLTPEKAELGAALFADERLIGGQKACASCHGPRTGYTSAAPVELQVAGAKRSLNVPSLVNVAWQYAFGLDGRAPTLEDELNAHATALAVDWAQVLAALSQDPVDRALFERASGSPAATQRAVVQALSSYLRTVRSGPGAYDHFLGGDKAALTREADGGRLAFDKLGCSSCHRAPRFLDAELHPLPDGSLPVRTPGLRNVVDSGPWLHDGSARTLAEVLTAHALKPAAKSDAKAKPVRLSSTQVAQLKAFLEALSGPVEAMPAPVVR
jgi:cytochrome c peroxidase